MAGAVSIKAGSPLAPCALLLLACAVTLRAQVPTKPADTTIEELRPTPRQVAELDFPAHPSISASPNGRFLAALQTRPDPVLWIVPTDGGEPFAFRKTWATYSPRWAPSGNRIGFIAAIGPPRIWTVEVDPESGRPIDPPRMLIRTNANAFAFSPDGERIALVSSRATAAGRSEIHIVEWESRRSRVLLRESGTIYWLDWAPDAESIYYGVIPTDSPGDATHRVVRAHVRTGSSENVLEVEEFLGLSSDGARLAYRPAGEQHADHAVVELATTAGEILVQLLMPARPTARWGAGLGSLFQTRVAGMKTEIWEFSY